MKQVQTMVVSSLCLYLSLVFLTCPMAVSGGRRRHRKLRSHQHRHHQKHLMFDGIPPVPFSSRLVVSESLPTKPPWKLFRADLDSLDYRNSPQDRRKRSLPFEPVCRDIGQWVALSHSHDIYGHDVEILQDITIGGVNMKQYFYETRCAEDTSVCRGVDSNLYDSSCENKYIWTYGYVRFENNEEGWRQIRITGSCNCAIRRKSSAQGQVLSLLDLL